MRDEQLSSAYRNLVFLRCSCKRIITKFLFFKKIIFFDEKNMLFTFDFIKKLVINNDYLILKDIDIKKQYK
ncbi:hypothetical protein MHOMSp_01688 [Metamycoplasma hominis]|nr:hypothetical protein MHOMSp_01688 [Metamycoplasma hominis]